MAGRRKAEGAHRKPWLAVLLGTGLFQLMTSSAEVKLSAATQTSFLQDGPSASWTQNDTGNQLQFSGRISSESLVKAELEQISHSKNGSDWVPPETVYTHGYWNLGNGSVVINGSHVECRGGHGYYYRPDYWEWQKQQEGVWQQPWLPEEGKFLIPRCFTGRASNLLNCVHGALLMAGLLNRTLIVPIDNSERAEYDWQKSIDVGHVNRCFGNNTAITLDEFQKKYKKSVSVDYVVCIDRDDCMLTDKRSKHKWLRSTSRIRHLRVSLNATKLAAPKILPTTPSYLLENYGKLGKGVLYFETQRFVKFVDYPYFRESFVVDAPFKRRGKCSTGLALQPPKAIMNAAKEYIEYFWGDQPFLAVHLRQGDFVNYCKGVNARCWYTIDEAAECLRRHLERTNLSAVYISTDGSARQIATIQWDLRAVLGRRIEVAAFPLNVPVEVEKWASKLLTLGYDIRKMNVRIPFEKLVSAYSRVFVGSVGSSFSVDIMRLRHGLGTASCADDFYCGPPKKLNPGEHI